MLMYHAYFGQLRCNAPCPHYDSILVILNGIFRYSLLYNTLLILEQKNKPLTLASHHIGQLVYTIFTRTHTPSTETKCFLCYFMHLPTQASKQILCWQGLLFIQFLGTYAREEIKWMNFNYTKFKFPQLKNHAWHKNFYQRMSSQSVDLVSRLL